MKYLQFLIILFLTVSCKNENEKFPFSEDAMVQSKMYGMLLEYALFDTTKIEFVNTILCDTLKKNDELIFSKIETKIDDSSYFYFHLCEYEPIINDYIGMIYVDINKFDSIYMYCFDYNLKYSTNEFIKVIEDIAEHNKSTVEETIKHRKINNNYVPHFYFVVMTDYSDYESGFVEKVIRINKQINALMGECSLKVFGNEKVAIIPFIEITSGFTDIYKSRLKYNTLPIVDEEILIKID